MAFRGFEDSPWNLRNMQDEITRAVERVWNHAVPPGILSGQPWMPLVDMYDMTDRYIVHAEVPGLSSEDVEVSYLNGTLTLRGDKKYPEGIQEDDQRGMRLERRYGRFTRTIDLPDDIDADKLSARCRDGLLTVSIPKTQDAVPRAVKIPVEQEKKSGGQ